MAFITTSLPNDGHTTHFWVSYDDTLAESDGLDLALDLLNYCESDLALISSWFPGVMASFYYTFPIRLQITGQSGGAEWVAVPIAGAAFVTLKPGSMPTTPYLRYLVVSEVTEMFMYSQGKGWFALQNEGSKGESLSRFLGSQFLSIRGLSKTLFGHSVVHNWLNDPIRFNFVDVALDDIEPDAVTGCGTCFIFFLKDQLGFTIQHIIAAGAGTLGGVYTNLIGKQDGWQTFKDIVDLHYPLGRSQYYPPLDNIFPAADLRAFSAPPLLSWVSNTIPNVAWIFLAHSIAVDIDVMLSSDDQASIKVPTSVKLSNSVSVPLVVQTQGAAFNSKVVNLTASYAGRDSTIPIKVVRPEDLPVAPLEIEPLTNNDPCAQHFVGGSSQDFGIKNPYVLMNRRGLTYNWTVIGAIAPITNTATLTIPSLPMAGSKVTIKVTLKNALGIQAKGSLEFTTTQLQTGLREDIRRLNCSLRRLKAINTQIPPDVPVQEAEILEYLRSIEGQSRQMAAAAQHVVASVKATRASLKARET
jgi:hypothetical protein